MEREATGIDLLGDQLAVVAAGQGELGGTHGVVRELVCLRGIARTQLGRNGKPLYRFIGLFDNDKAGRLAIGDAQRVDVSISEYKDVFRIHPFMPSEGTTEPRALKSTFERINEPLKGLDWELEDFLPSDFVEAFLSDYPSAATKAVSLGGRTHRDLTRDGKARLHRYIKLNAIHSDLKEIIGVLKALRFYLGIQAPATPSAVVLPFTKR